MTDLQPFQFTLAPAAASSSRRPPWCSSENASVSVVGVTGLRHCQFTLAPAAASSSRRPPGCSSENASREAAGPGQAAAARPTAAAGAAAAPDARMALASRTICVQYFDTVCTVVQGSCFWRCANTIAKTNLVLA